MATPLYLRRAILVTFPELTGAWIRYVAPFHLALEYAVRDGCKVCPQALREFVARNHDASLLVEIREVPDDPNRSDDAIALLRTSRLPLDAVEDAWTSKRDVLNELSGRWPGLIVSADVLDRREVVVFVLPATPPEVREEIAAAVRVLISFSSKTVAIRNAASPSVPRRRFASFSDAAARLLTDDQSLLDEFATPVLHGEGLPRALTPLPDGSATYTMVAPGVVGLKSRLALHDRVLVAMPRQEAEMPKKYGVSFDEFLAAVSTGRLVPVFGFPPEAYDPFLIDSVVDAGAPRVILRGEQRLRELASFVADNPAAAMIARGDEDARGVHADLRQNQPESLATAVLDALATIVGHARMLAKRNQSMAPAWHPMVRLLDGMVQRTFGLPPRELELSFAMFTKQLCDALGTVAVCNENDVLHPYLTAVYGAHAGQFEKTVFPEPESLGQLLLGAPERMTLAEFATAFDGAAVQRMRSLMRSPKMTQADDMKAAIRDLDAEARAFRGRGGQSYAGALVVLSLASGVPQLGTIGLWATVASLAIEGARRFFSRTRASRFDKLAAFLSRSSVEAVMLAKIQDATLTSPETHL